MDYDGTVLYSYALDELQELTELPDLPEHDGLICQGWNWTLEKLKAFNQPVTVGAKYITDDGATRLHITIATTGRMTFPLYYAQNTGVGTTYYSVIDWGDGSEPEKKTGSTVDTSHTYSKPGDYTITITPVDTSVGGSLKMAFGTNSCTICGKLTNDLYIHLNMIQSVEIGSSVTSIGAYAFEWCYGMAEYHVKATTPPTLANTYVFQGIPSDCVIYVPSGCLSAYQSATNWSTYASYMQEEEEE